MIKIEIDNINNILDEFVFRVSKIKIQHIKRKNGARLANTYIDYFKTNIDKIISCKPQDFQAVIYDFEQQFKNKTDKSYKLFNKYMLNAYKVFSDENGYWLASELAVNVCPYCNRQYTFTATENDKKRTRPQFDHFFDKSIHPYLSLSFYNLIPCCPTCNLIKRQHSIDINPYIRGFDENCKFKIDKIEECVFNKESDKWNISLPKDGEHLKHVEVFALNLLYNKHKDYVEEIVFKAQAYNEGYYSELISTFSYMGLTKNEMDRMIFGSYIEVAEHKKRPLSKLTKDIIDQLDIK